MEQENIYKMLHSYYPRAAVSEINKEDKEEDIKEIIKANATLMELSRANKKYTNNGITYIT